MNHPEETTTSYTHNTLSGEVRDVINTYNNKIRDLDEEAGMEQPTQVDWTKLAVAAMRLGRRGSANNLGAGTTAQVRDVQRNLPGHIPTDLALDFATDVTKAAEESRSATR